MLQREQTQLSPCRVASTPGSVGRQACEQLLGVAAGASGQAGRQRPGTTWTLSKGPFPEFVYECVYGLLNKFLEKHLVIP